MVDDNELNRKRKIHFVPLYFSLEDKIVVQINFYISGASVRVNARLIVILKEQYNKTI